MRLIGVIFGWYRWDLMQKTRRQTRVGVYGGVGVKGSYLGRSSSMDLSCPEMANTERAFRRGLTGIPCKEGALEKQALYSIKPFQRKGPIPVS